MTDDLGYPQYLLDSLQLAADHLKAKTITVATAGRLLDRDIIEMRRVLGLEKSIVTERPVAWDRISAGEAKQRDELTAKLEAMSLGKQEDGVVLGSTMAEAAVENPPA